MSETFSSEYLFSKIKKLSNRVNTLEAGVAITTTVTTTTTEIPFNAPTTVIDPLAVTGPLAFTVNSVGATAGNTALIRVMADGINQPDLSAFKSIGTGTYDNTLGVVHQFWFVYDGVDYCVSMTKPVTIAPPVGGETWTDLTFTTNANLTNTAGVWTPATANSWAQIGLDSKTLTGDGAIRVTFQAGDGNSFVIGFNASNLNQDYTNYEYGLYIAPGGVISQFVNGSGAGIGYTASAGDNLAIRRVGNTFKIQSSTDGTTWTDRYTFVATSTATFYVNLDIYNDGGTAGKCYFPQQTGLV